MRTDLDSVLQTWAQTNALPEDRADAIKRAARSNPPTDPAVIWWLDFTRTWAGTVIDATRSWEAIHVPAFSALVPSNTPAPGLN